MDGWTDPGVVVVVVERAHADARVRSRVSFRVFARGFMSAMRAVSQTTGGRTMMARTTTTTTTRFLVKTRARCRSRNETKPKATMPTETSVVSTTTFAEANEGELIAACEAFAPGETFTLSDTSGGVNNHVRYADCDNGDRYVVRLYNNGQETDRVAFEHAVLAAVEPRVRESDAGFVVPRALKAKNGSGETYAVLPSGDCASVFELIPGSLPKTRFADAVGEATAALSACMEEAEGDVRAVFPTSPTSVYRNIFGAFENKGGSREAFFTEAETNPGLDGVREAVTRLLDFIRALENRLEEIERAGGLPETLIHGDVHYDNSLADETTGQVTGIIDFEFASYDWRMMEAAAGLSKYVGEKDPTPYVVDYITGYCRRAKPTEAEIDALPDLIKLRVLETVVYFVARSAAGEDDISQLALRAENYAARVAWIDANAQVIRDAMRSALA
jgi:homoserine kinase type II